METMLTRRRLALLVVLAVAVGAALPGLTDAAVRVAQATIGTAQLKDGAVTNAKVRRGSLRFTAFAKGQVAPADLKGIRAGGVLTGRFPAPGLANGSVKAPQIATGAVGRTEIASGAVGSDELASGAVRAADIANGSIGAAKIAPNSIGRGQIAPGGVGASELADGAVGVAALAALPGARAYRSAPTTVPNGQIVEVPLTDAAYNQGGAWATNRPTRLTAPVAGVYLATASVVFEPNGSGLRYLGIAPAGQPNSAYSGNVQLAANLEGEQTSLSTSTIVKLEAGDSISMVVQQNSGRDLTVLGTGQQTALALQFLSP